ncbi:hypothetical protein AL532_23315 [Pseudomonas monteilii]|uniref:Uncharacterized protein n=1 Tax=Pseudomonas kurunegalensis TaxID=485880 RepID=A0ACC5UJP2_9PSED|nr:hypothetical protein AL532_23315 [Pseudomonas monteilii]MBV4514678.1 hypothetical protein [Pseudomonas kurunegalensis]
MFKIKPWRCSDRGKAVTVNKPHFSHFGEQMMNKPDDQRQKGPHSSDHATTDQDLGFDPDSPDLDDPQVDPQGPAKPPRDVEKKA